MKETEAARAICGSRLAPSRAAENSTEKMRDFIVFSFMWEI
jgi:hypothetical protein